MKNRENTIVFHKRKTIEYYDTWVSKVKSLGCGIFDKKIVEVKILVARRYMRGSMRLLDAGCGIGNITGTFTENSDHTIGIDFSSMNLRKAKENLQGKDNTDILLADLTAIPLMDESIDIIVSFSTLYYVEQLNQALNEFYRVLKKDGYAVFELGNRYSWNAFEYRFQSGLIQHLIAPWQMKRVLKEANLEVEVMRIFQLLPSIFYVFFGKILSPTFGGLLFDEWVSSPPFLRNLAFRYLWVCRKRG